MNLKSLELICGILDEKIYNRDFEGSIGMHKRTVEARDELRLVIEYTKKQSMDLRRLALKNKVFMPVTMPFNIEVDVL